MTDKLQKIREELERLKEETPIGLSEHENGVEQGRMEIINALSLFLDSMQEEPVSNVWHDAQIDPPQAKKKILAINEYGSCEVDYAINMALYWPKVIKWAYIDDLLKLDNSCQSCENLQEEPVSEDYKNALNTEAITFLQEQQIVPNFYADIIVKAVKHGANWQKKQLVTKAIDAQCFGFQGAALFSFRLPSDKYLVGSNVKVIVIKEE